MDEVLYRFICLYILKLDLDIAGAWILMYEVQYPASCATTPSSHLTFSILRDLASQPRISVSRYRHEHVIPGFALLCIESH